MRCTSHHSSLSDPAYMPNCPATVVAGVILDYVIVLWSLPTPETENQPPTIHAQAAAVGRSDGGMIRLFFSVSRRKSDHFRSLCVGCCRMLCKSKCVYVKLCGVQVCKYKIHSAFTFNV